MDGIEDTHQFVHVTGEKELRGIEDTHQIGIEDTHQIGGGIEEGIEDTHGIEWN